MFLIIIITVIFLLISFLFILLFNKFDLVKLNYRNKKVPYAGGTIILLSIFSSLEIYHLRGYISSFKLLFYILSLFCIYFFGFIDDLFGKSEIKGIKNNLKAFFHMKFSTGIIKAAGIIIVSCYYFNFLNDEFWFLKGILTSLITNIFNLFDLRPGRCLKIFYVILMLLALAYLQWTKEILVFSFIVCSLYYIFDAFSFSMLGDSGSNLIGFIAGIIFCEAVGTNLYILTIAAAAASAAQIILDKYSLSEFIQRNHFLNFIDKILTERQDKLNVKTRKRNCN